jgi:hypothetical protein
MQIQLSVDGQSVSVCVRSECRHHSGVVVQKTRSFAPESLAETIVVGPLVSVHVHSECRRLPGSPPIFQPLPLREKHAISLLDHGWIVIATWWPAKPLDLPIFPTNPLDFFADDGWLLGSRAAWLSIERLSSIDDVAGHLIRSVVQGG